MASRSYKTEAGELAAGVARYVTTHNNWEHMTKSDAAKAAVMVILTDFTAASQAAEIIKDVLPVPPHACWQCKAAFDELDYEERLDFWQAMSQQTPFPGELTEEDLVKARRKGQDWVDEHLRFLHEDHDPSSWV